MRIFRLIATPVVLLGLLGVLLWSAAWGWRSLTAPLPSPSPTPCVTQEASVVTPAQVTINVFNGGFTSGLAGKVGQHFKAAGFTVARTSNTDERVTTTIVRGNKEQDAHLQLVASHLKDATIEHDDRVDGSVDVLVGSQFAQYTDKPLGEVPVEGGTTCVVAPSPDPSLSPLADPSA